MDNNQHRNATATTPLSNVLSREVWQLDQMALETRVLEAISASRASYPVHRSLRLAARIEVDALFDDLALNLGWRAHRLLEQQLLLEADGLFVAAHASRKGDYCSCAFYLWADGIDRVERARQAIEARVGAVRIHEPIFSVDWHFVTQKGNLESAEIEEMADDKLCDGAYPEIPGSVGGFIARYLDAPETVLVLQGPPGTGKTRLIRAILGELSRRAGGEAQALYTGDKKALESDEIYVKFITGRHDAFVVEDADHLLSPRAEGNEHLHRFLAIADGVVRAQGRKIIFSTNLPNLGDLDDALVRPGRCFARVMVRELSLSEAAVVVSAMTPGDRELAAAVLRVLQDKNERSYSLAEIYQAVRNNRMANTEVVAT